MSCSARFRLDRAPSFRHCTSSAGARIVAALLLAWTGAASATILYRMVDPTCVDSNHGERVYPGTPIEPDTSGPGPKLCADVLTLELRLLDTYVPGTSLSQNQTGQPNAYVASFSINDGARSVDSTFDIAPWGYPNDGPITGILPAFAGPGVLRIFWDEGWFFNALANGTWTFGVEFGAKSDGPCGLGSIPGPYPLGVCTPTGGHYTSIGTYAGFQRVPEPGTLLMVLLALTGLFLVPPNRAAGQSSAQSQRLPCAHC